VHIYYRFVKQKFEILSISNSAYDIFTNCCWRRLVTSPRRQRARYLFLVACVCCYVCYHYSSTIKRLQLSLWCMTIYHHEPQRTRRDDNGLQRTTVDRNGLQRTTTVYKGLQWTATDYNGPQRSTANDNGLQRTTTDHKGRQRTTTDNNRAQRTKTNRSVPQL